MTIASNPSSLLQLHVNQTKSVYSQIMGLRLEVYFVFFFVFLCYLKSRADLHTGDLDE